MVTISAKSEYGISLLAYLAKNIDHIVSLAEVAEKEFISRGYLEEVAADLKKTGILKGKRGRGGGYMLARKPKDIKISEIITALEGPISPVMCTGTGKCFKEKTCGTKKIWVALKHKIEDYLSEISLADIV